MKILKEDKVVKFGGQVDPKYGWCVLVVGGPGSGKSTAFKNKMLLQTKKFDPDDLKKFKYKPDDFKTFKYHDSDFHGEYFVLSSGKKFYPADYGIKPPYDTTNPDVTSALHELTRSTRLALKKQMLSKNANGDDRLPNITFDITGSDIEDITSVVDTAKSIGYKIGIVWVITELKVAYDRRVNNASRKMNPNIVVRKHSGVHHTLATLVMNNIVEQVDDFWVLLDVVSIENLGSDEYDDIKVSNVFRVDSSSELASFDDTVISEIGSDSRIRKYLSAYHEINSKSLDEIDSWLATGDVK